MSAQHDHGKGCAKRLTAVGPDRPERSLLVLVLRLAPICVVRGIEFARELDCLIRFLAFNLY